MKNWVQVIRKKTPYRIETAISKAQNVVHVWAGTFQAKKNWEPFLEEWLDLNFDRSSPAQNWFVYLFVCSMFQYFTVSYSIYNIIAHWHLPFHSYKMKAQPHTGHRF